MGHRALVAYRRPDGLFNLHFSGWGASDLQLEERITVDTPMGGENDMAPPGLDALTEMLDEATPDDEEPAVADHVDSDGRAVDPKPVAVKASMMDAMEQLDEAAYEAFYVVDASDDDYADADTFDVTGFSVASDLQGNFLLFHPRHHSGEERHNLRRENGRVRGLQEAFGSLVDDDDATDLGRDSGISERAANERFIGKMLEFYGSSMDRWLLAWSPAIRTHHLEMRPDAFFEMDGRHRVLGDMYPQNPHAPEWAIPPDFPSVKTADGERVSLG